MGTTGPSAGTHKDPSVLPSWGQEVAEDFQAVLLMSNPLGDILSSSLGVEVGCLECSMSLGTPFPCSDPTQ